MRSALEKKHLLLIPVHVLNMEFPGRWDVFPIEEYATAIARSPGKAGVEVMAQARANGRLVDHFKVTVNGSEVLHVDFPISTLFTVADLPNWRVQCFCINDFDVLQKVPEKQGHNLPLASL
jgi:hypothetical protein